MFMPDQDSIVSDLEKHSVEELIPASVEEAPPLESPFPLQIEKLVYGGDGLARKSSGEVCFVPFSAPGDDVLAELQAGPAKGTKARIVSLRTPAPERVQPRCDVFGVCGGCQWQHIESSAQQLWKSRIVEESLHRLGGLKDVVVEPILRANGESQETNWRYRNRVQWELQQGPEGLKLGYVQAQSHALVAFSDCQIISESMNDLYHYLQATLKSALFQRQPKLGEALRRIEAMENSKGDCLIILYGFWHPALPTLASQLIGERDNVQGVAFIDQNRRAPKTRTLAGKGFLEQTLGDFRFQVSAGSFFQTNTAAARVMLAEVQQWLPAGTKSLLDLYAGGAVFAIGLHEKAEDIVAVESNTSAIHDAQSNLRLNNVKNVTLLKAPVDEALKNEKRTFEAAILDPPRAGSSTQTIAWLAEHITDRILYISCNPATLARDLKQFASSGWQIERVQPIELFPQTYHIESMVQLRKVAL
jgi:23S rRNA (uracil1939-C5)-methyltransferase